jgi:hypothetical protein
MWSDNFYYGRKLNSLIIWSCIFSSVIISACSFLNVMYRTQTRGQALLDLAPLGLSHVLGLLFVFSRSNSFFASHTLVFFLASSLIFTHLTNQMILCATTHMPFDWKQPLLLPFVALCGANYTGWPQCDIGLYFYCYLGLIVAVVLKWATRTINEICGFLGIRCLTIPVVPPTPHAFANRS